MKIGVMFGSPETTTGGNALKFYASVRLDIRRIGSIKEGDEVIGSETKVKVVKNKVARRSRRPSSTSCTATASAAKARSSTWASSARILDKSRPWYAYNGEKIGQGKDNAREFLRENRDMAVEIENKVREAMGVPLVAVEKSLTDDAAGLPICGGSRTT